jgi:hypothetical protein
VRIWSAAVPVDATGPDDPAITFVPVVADAILGLGYCAPVEGPDRPAPSSLVAMWRLEPDGARSLTPGRLRPRSYDVLGALYGAPPVGRAPPVGGTPSVGGGPDGARTASLPLVPSWPSGRYVFDVGGRWFGAVLAVTAPIDGGRAASAAPASPPG